MPKRSCSPIAEPTTSARSHAANGDLAQNPLKPDDRHGVVVAAGLREIATGDDAELDTKVLEQNRHEIGDQDDAEQGVAELRPALQVGRPVAGVSM